MRQEVSPTELNIKPLVKLIFASAVLSLSIHLVYEWLSSESFSGVGNSETRISININDLLSTFLYELLILFLITFSILSAIRLLYFYIVSRHNNTKNFS